MAITPRVRISDYDGDTSSLVCGAPLPFSAPIGCWRLKQAMVLIRQLAFRTWLMRAGEVRGELPTHLQRLFGG